ncbi:MAG TPA: NUDIX domain-containing protein [Kineosporiaceae bacterium]|nr:NUDIX domain-containing protein [Kineosporiaceae bacterium]
MAATPSAGLLLFRRTGTPPRLEVLLAHPGGPYWRHKDNGAWSIPKGEFGAEEDPLAAARREFTEELGLPAPDGPFVPLGSSRQASGKQVSAWAVQGDVAPDSAVSNTVEIEWPPKSGKRITIPEIDRVAWFDLSTAREKINAGQASFLDRLAGLLGAPGGHPSA